jgi:MYXO-CTERM domain-containing protein
MSSSEASDRASDSGCSVARSQRAHAAAFTLAMAAFLLAARRSRKRFSAGRS